MSASKLFLLIAVVCFVLAALGVGIEHVSVGWVGLAFFAGASVV